MATLLVQIPEPKEGQSAWQWVAFLVAVVSFLAIGWLGNRLYDFLIKRGDEWKSRAETCQTDFGKTADALKLANDSTERLARVVTEGGGRVESRLDDNARKLDRILDALFNDREGSRRRSS